MRARDIIIEDYRTAAARFVQQGAPREEVDELIARFRLLVDRNQIRDAEQRQIDRWARQGWEGFRAFVRGWEGHVTPTQAKRKHLVGDSVVLREDDRWLVVIPLDKEASCFHGRDTDWCTAKPHRTHWEEHFIDSRIVLIYAIGKQGQGSYAIAGDEDAGTLQVFDQRDREITPQQLRERTGLDANRLMDAALSLHGRRIRQAQVPYANKVRDWLASGSNTQRDPEIERAAIRSGNPELAMRYLYRVMPGRAREPWPHRLVELAFQMYEPSDPPDGDDEDGWEDPRLRMQANWGRASQEVLAALDHVPAGVEDIIARRAPQLAVHVRDPSPRLVRLASISNLEAFRHFLGRGLLDGATILDSIARNPARIKLVPRQTEEMQLAAVKNRHGAHLEAALNLLVDPGERVQVLAATQDPSRALVALADPAKPAILAALSRAPNLISRVKPSMIDDDVLRTALGRSWVSSQHLPRTEDGRPAVELSPAAQRTLAKSFWRDYRKYGTEMVNRNFRSSMLKYHLPTVERLITDPGARAFMAALRRRFEVPGDPSTGSL